MRIFILIFFFLSFIGKAQIQISGKVVDEFGIVVSDVLVYVDGSSISTYSDANGIFALDIPKGNYNLVFRKDEYFTETVSVNSQLKGSEVVLKKSDLVELEEAHIVQMSEDKWKEFYEIFKPLFLGQNEAAKNCEILNPKALRFRYDEENMELSASASKPLIIHNKFLGYEIEYDLEEFQMNYRNQTQFVAGTSFFSQMDGNKSKWNKWKKNRLDSYKGSLMHFIRSLYDEKLKENGFVINRLLRKENPDYKLYRERIQAMVDRGEVIHVSNPPPQIIQTLIKKEVPYDSLRINLDNRKVLFFDGLYDVEFTGEKEEMAYVQKTKGGNLIGNQVSVIYLLGEKFVEIDPRGNFYPPNELMTEGYFTWEKIANLLPLDFEP